MNQYPEGSKVSRLQTLKQVEKSRGVTPPDLLNAPKLLWQHDNCWIAYTSIKEHTYQELESYMRVTGHILERWEIEAVMELAKYKDRELTSWRHP